MAPKGSSAATKRTARDATAAAATAAAVAAARMPTIEEFWDAFCKLRTDHENLQIQHSKQAQMISDLQAELKDAGSAHNVVSDVIPAVQKQLAAFEEDYAEQMEAMKQSGSTRTYAAAVGQPPATKPPRHATPIMHTFRLVPSPHGNTQGALNHLPTSTAEATRTAIDVLQDLQQDLRAASVRVQWSEPKSIHAKSKPVAVVIGLMQTDAYLLKSLLWEERAKNKLQSAGWRLSIHLPSEELKCKQALWAHFGKQLRAWADAGKKLIYTKHHQAVTVEGEAVALQLPLAAAVPCA